MALDASVLDSLKQGQPSYSPLNLALFTDTTFTVQPESIQNGPAGGLVLTGRIAGQADSMVILSWQGGILDGHISTQVSGSDQPAFFQVRYDPGSGLETVEQINQAGFPEENDAATASTDSAGTAQAAAVETGSRLDVQVFYDGAALSGVGGQAAMNNLINTAIAESNQGFANSGVNTRFNLVHAAITTYDETNFDWTTTLNRLTTNGDGFMDEVHATRNAYAADLTILLINDASTACGISWVMSSLSTSFQNNAFSVVAWPCATGYYSFAHEAGHVMGSVHDRANTASPGAFPYSYGYQDPGSAFRTIMAYACAPGGCPRIDYWSNPAVSYGGKPTGVDPNNASGSADNALSLNNTLSTAINFRTAPAPLAPTGLSYILGPGAQVQLRWTDASFNEDGFRIERALHGTGSFSQVSSAGANSVQAFDSRISTCAAAYDYRARAYNSSGTSATTNTVAVTLPACPVSGPYRAFLPVVRR